MTVNGQSDQRNIFEIRLLATALLTDNDDIRDRVFNSDCFIGSAGKQLFDKLRAVYVKSPGADYYCYLSALTEEERAAMIAAMQGAISQTVDEERIDSTLESLERGALDEKLKNGLLDIITMESFERQEVQRLFEDTEYKSVSQSSAEKYLADYNIPLELVPTGFDRLDEKLNGGFIKGTLISIGARPSVGKTTFAINIAKHNPGLKILFFSLEMSSRMIYDRLIADCADIDYGAAGMHRVNFETVKSVLRRYENLTVIDDVSEVERICSIIRELKPELVIIDYVQIVQSKNKFVDNRQRVDYISQMLKRTAKKTGSCIASLSQLTRSGKEKPTMSALKESGGLEQDSDYIILLHRPYVLDKSSDDVKPGEASLILDKNKFGSTGEIEYDFDGRHQRFTELKEEEVAHMSKPKEKEEQSKYDENDDLPF